MNYKYNQKLSAKVEKELDDYIERIKAVEWFKPKNLDKANVDKQINVVLKAFGVDASIEYRSLKTANDWDAARGAAWGASWDAAWDAAWGASWDAAWDAALDAARGAARDAALDAARGAARGAARDAAWGASWGAADLVAKHTPKTLGYSDKYPNGNFIQLIPLWEAGLYPIGVANGRFICYVPDGGEALLEDDNDAN